MKFLKILFLASLHVSFAFGQTKTGVVYEDINGNRQFDESDKTLADVRVSDGYAIVRTGDDGNFMIEPHPDARFLFITTPSGYKNVDKHYIPLDKSKDSTYSFALVVDENQQPDQLRFIHVTDTETPLYGPWIDNVRNYAKQQDVSLIMHTGDICYEPGMRFHASQITSELMGVTTRYTVGNHDLVKGAYGEKLFEDLFGPTYYSFEMGPAHFVVTPMAGGDYPPGYTMDQVISWLKQDLEMKDKNKPLIFINHDFSNRADFILKGKTEEIDLLDYQLKVWLYGYWHNNFVFQNKGVYVVGTGAPNKGGIDNSTGQFLVLDVNRQGIENIQPIYTNLRSHIQVMSPQSEGMSMLHKNHLAVHVNAYDSERHISEIQAIIYNDKGNRLATGNLSACSDWHWQAELPFRQSLDTRYELHVVVRFDNGQEEIRRQYFGPARQANKKHLQLQWITSTGGNIWKASPLIVGEQLFIGTMDDGKGDRQAIHALHKKTGGKQWSFPTTNSVKHQLRHEDGVLLASDIETNIYALDIRNGKVKWQRSPDAVSIPAFVSGSVLKDGVYYSRLGKQIGAWDVRTGENKWLKDIGAGESTSAEWTVEDNKLYIGANWDALYAYDARSGKSLWKRNEDGLRFRSGGVTIRRDTLYTTGLNGLFKLHVENGKTIQHTLKSDDFKVMANPLLSGNLWIMPTSTNGVKAYDRTTLEEKWHFPTGEALVCTAPYTTPDERQLVATVESSVVEAHGMLFFGASDGYLYMLDKQGKLIDKVCIGAPIFAEVTIEGNLLYVADFAGNVSCFEITY